MKFCILNYADGVFIKGQDRLKHSLENIHFAGDTLMHDTLPHGWPTHDDVPWGFKVYAFEEARNKGYTAALWIDSAGIVIRPLDPIMKILEERGVFLFSRLSSTVGEWSSDAALEAMGMSREEAFHIPEISGFCIGIHFGHPAGQVFLDEWKKRADDGISFIGVRKPYTVKDSLKNENGLVSKDPRVKGHRQDQTIASIIAYRLGIPSTQRYIFDLIGEATKGRTYATSIPLDTVLVQNRDIKSDSYLHDLSTYMTPLQEKKLLPYAKTLTYSYWRYVKDWIKKIYVT